MAETYDELLGVVLHDEDPEWMRSYGELEVEDYLRDPKVVALARSFGYEDTRQYAKALLGFKDDGLDDMRVRLARIRESQKRAESFLEGHPSRAAVLAQAQEINERYGFGLDPAKLAANLPED